MQRNPWGKNPTSGLTYTHPHQKTDPLWIEVVKINRSHFYEVEKVTKQTRRMASTFDWTFTMQFAFP